MGRITLIDGLRGIAALAVVLYHLVGRTPAHFVTDYGYLGVAIFFVLSGFVIAMTLGEHVSAGRIGRFMLRRSLRLDPPYWASIALGLALAVFAAHMGVAKNAPEIGQVLAHLIYAQDLLRIEPLSAVYWTLCLEIQFYLFLAVLLWPGALRMTRFQVGFLTLIAASVIEQSLTDASPAGFFLPYWFGFALGALTWWSISGAARPAFLYGAWAICLLATPLPHGIWFATSVATAVLIFVASRQQALSRWLSGRPWQFLGRTSYSLYLIHPMIGWGAQSFALRYTNQWIALAIGIGVSIASAWLAYLLVEKPSILLSRKVSIHVPRAEVPMRPGVGPEVDNTRRQRPLVTLTGDRSS